MEAADLFAVLRVEIREHGEHNHCTEGWVQLRHCPFCNSDNFHLGFSKRGRFFSCWKCGGLNAKKVLTALGATPAQQKEFFGSLKRLAPEPSRPQGHLEEPKFRGPLLPRHRRYLEKRGFDPDELAKLWELEGIGIGGDLSWRIYIPIIDRGERVSWTTRAVGNTSRRYRSATASQETIPHKECLYGIDYVAHTAVVVEGPTDAWRIGPGAVATFGISFTTAQVLKLSRIPRRLILFDNEPAAQRQARKLASQLSCFPGETLVLECSAEDPGQMSERDVCHLKHLAQLA